MEEEASGRWLPVDIIHHIFSYFNAKEKAKARLLSKYWLEALRGNNNDLQFMDQAALEFKYPYLIKKKKFEKRLECCSRCVDKGRVVHPIIKVSKSDKNCLYCNTETFKNCVNNTLQKHQGPIDEFNLSILYKYRSLGAIEYDTWLGIAVQKGVKILQLTDATGSFDTRLEVYPYCIPRSVLEAESLTELYLSGCRIPMTCMLKNIRVLHLRSVIVHEETFGRLIVGCFTINDLIISRCRGFRTIKVNNPCSIRHLEIYDYEARSIQVDAPTLESIKLTRHPGCSVEFHTSKNLRKYSLEFSFIPGNFFDDFKSKFPCLEFLELIDCTGDSKRIELVSPSSLKYIKLSSSSLGVIDVEIKKAPSVMYFRCDSEGKIVLDLSSANVSCHVSRYTRISIKLWNQKLIDASWFLKLNEQLSTFLPSKILLNISFGGKYKILPHGRDILSSSSTAVLVEELRLHLAGKLASKFTVHGSINFIDRLFWACQPKSLVLYTNPKHLNENLVVVCLLKLLDKSRNQEFSKSAGIKIWRNHLKQVDLEIYTFHEEEWQQKFLNLNNFLDEIKKFEGVVKIRFRLEWDASPISSNDRRVDILRLTNLSSNSLSVPWHVQDKVHAILC